MIGVSVAYPDVDPDHRPRTAQWMQALDARGRFLGMFYRFEDLDAWAASHPGREFRINCHDVGGVGFRWRVIVGSDSKPRWASVSLKFKSEG